MVESDSRCLNDRTAGKFETSRGRVVLVSSTPALCTLHARTLHVDKLEDRRVLSGVVTIGDSWAWLVAAGAPGSAPAAPSGFSSSLGTVMATFQPGVPVLRRILRW